eukprot:3371842-Pyramimonas_sp.AAC.1
MSRGKAVSRTQYGRPEAFCQAVRWRWLALQLIMLSPFDSLFKHTTWISKTIDLYADDVTIAIMGTAIMIIAAAVKILPMLVDVLTRVDLNPATHKMTITSSNPKIGRVAQGR